jgi:hypothetical protein
MQASMEEHERAAALRAFLIDRCGRLKPAAVGGYVVKRSPNWSA